jgi:hypothetical protein
LQYALNRLAIPHFRLFLSIVLLDLLSAGCLGVRETAQALPEKNLM